MIEVCGFKAAGQVLTCNFAINEIRSGYKILAPHVIKPSAHIMTLTAFVSCQVSLDYSAIMIQDDTAMYHHASPT